MTPTESGFAAVDAYGERQRQLRHVKLYSDGKNPNGYALVHVKGILCTAVVVLGLPWIVWLISWMVNQ